MTPSREICSSTITFLILSSSNNGNYVAVYRPCKALSISTILISSSVNPYIIPFRGQLIDQPINPSIRRLDLPLHHLMLQQHPWTLLALDALVVVAEYDPPGAVGKLAGEVEVGI
jgi:hypothetical protein